MRNFRDYWKNRKINWEQAYWNLDHPHRKMIVNILKEFEIRAVCEIGCASGANLYLIKKQFPQATIAGCDLNKDAIDTAKEMFKGMEHYPKKDKCLDVPDEIEFRVGDIKSIPFNGEAYNLVMTDACLIYQGSKEMFRVFRELRRIGYEKFLFCEFHSKSWWRRLILKLTTGYNAYDYEKLLQEHHFKYIKINKIPKEVWSGRPWEEFGHIITCIR